MRPLGNSTLTRALRRLAVPITVAALAFTPSGAGAEGPVAVADPQSEALASAPDVDEPAQAAVAVLEELTTVLAGEAGPAPAPAPDLTTSLVALQQVYDDLPPTERREARRLLARPTDAVGNMQQDLINYGDAPVTTICNTRLCVHRATAGKHQASAAWAAQTLAVVDAVWAEQIGTMGYRPPTPDGTLGNPVGVTGSRVDVYLGELSDDGFYGYANWDPGKTNGGYLVLDNDFTGFASTPLDTLRVTAAHEFFHIVQFAYSLRADTWLMETTATWMEEQLFDSIDDNRQYLATSALAQPETPLDSDGFTHYGNWVFFENLAQRFDQRIVRTIWDKVAAGKRSTNAIDRATRARGSDLGTEFTRFAADNTMPGRTYPEGRAYPKARPVQRTKLGKSKRTTAWRTHRIDHLSAATTRFSARGKLSKRWRLRVQMRGASRIRAEVIVHRKDGSLSRHRVKLKKGTGRIGVGFDSRTLSSVTVTLANTSTDYRCWSGGPYTCRGRAKHDREPVEIRGVLLKR